MSNRRPNRPPTPTERDLARRIGPRSYRARRRRESQRKQGNLYDDLLRILVWHRTVFNSAIYWCLRVTGIYYFGHRQFLNVRTPLHRIKLPRLPSAFSGFRILHLSDLHLDLDPELTHRLIQRLETQEYDITVITGDFRNNIYGPHDECMRYLSLLRQHLRGPVYAVLGNHDYLAMVAPMEAMQIRVLLNEHIIIQRDTSRIILAGIDDPNIYRTDDLPRALRHTPPDTCTVLLSHSPAIHNTAAHHHIDLVLTGHTHAGQICLPGGIILLRNDSSPRHMLRRSWRHHATRGYTSPGTGACGVPVRIFCPPEATIHELHPTH